MTTKEIKASPELMKFFTRLLELKEYIAQQNQDDPVIRKIYDQLNDIIKEKA